jgi:triphosphoribosyl-dephospho-CoA synthetase
MEKAVSLGAALRDAAVHALLVIMTECEDTNVIHRAGYEFWAGEYKELAAAARDAFDPLAPGDYEPVTRLGRVLTERRASPGGAADLLACAFFMRRREVIGTRN